MHCGFILFLRRCVSGVFLKVAAVCCGHSQTVATFVFRIAVVSLDPNEPYIVATVCEQKATPQVRVFLFAKSFLLPAEYPAFGNRIDNISRVGVYRYMAAVVFEGFESFDDRQQFHSVVGRETEPLAELLAEWGRYQHYAVASLAGIALCCPVGVYCDVGVHVL